MRLTKFCFTVLAACCFLLTNQASADVVIASYATYATNTPANGTALSGVIAANTTAAGITSNITNDASDPLLRRAQSTNGSTDGTFGDGVTSNTTLPTAPTAGRLHFLNGNTSANTGVDGAEDANFFLNVTNGDASQSLTFDELLFDVLVQNVGNATTTTHNAYSVTFENTTTGSVTGVLGSATGLLADNDENIDLTGSGISLAAGEAGRFVFNFSGGGLGSNSSGTIDNIAITGQLVDAVAIPEPSSLALLGLGALGFVTRRRR